jgi:transposase
MSKHHTEDYKLSVIKYYKKYGSIRKTCKIFECSKSSLYRWLNKYNKTKKITRKKRELKYKFSKDEILFIKRYIYKYPNITLKELTKIINKKFKKNYTYLSIYYVVKKNKISYKILRQKYFPQKGDEEKELLEYYKSLTKYNMKEIISIDETAIYINMTKERGWSKKGTRAIVKTNIYPFKKFNVLCAIKYGKVIGIKVYKETGGLDKIKFIKFLEENIKNKYKNHLITLDNARFHRSKEVKEYIEKIGNKYLYCVRYRPKTNAIENFFNQLKHYIKLKSPQTYEEIVRIIKQILKSNIKKENLQNYFKYLYLQANTHIKKYT